MGETRLSKQEEKQPEDRAKRNDNVSPLFAMISLGNSVNLQTDLQQNKKIVLTYMYTEKKYWLNAEFPD